MAPVEFSVILPTRGESAHLRRAIASVLALEEDLEVVVGHDRRAGEPPLPEDLARAPRVRVVDAESPGPPGARNAAMGAAAGRLLAFLDDDDAWLPGHLPRAADLLARHPEALLVASDAWIFEDPTEDGSSPIPRDAARLPRFRPSGREHRITLREMLAANPILTPTVVLRRERLSPEDRFDPTLSVMEDYDLWLRLCRKQALMFDPIPAVVVRRRRSSASRDRKAMAEGSLRILRREESLGVPGGVFTGAEWKRRFARLYHDLAYACLVEGDGAGARRALRASIGNSPTLAKNYIYLLLSLFPSRIRRAASALSRSGPSPAPSGGPKAP